jgi:tripartite-type tricarboxylate transporter receptor subunit TctC
MRRSIRAVILAVGLALVTSAWGQAYPGRPLRVVIPFPAGGTTDLNARAIAAQLERQLGQSIVVDNRVGANGIIATELVARAAPDGHTLLYVSSSISLNPSIYRKLPYDTVKDFIPVTQAAAAVGFLIIASPSLPANSVKDLIALASRPDARVAFGSPGYGNSLHLAAEVFQARTGTHMLHVPYKGVAPALNAVMGGEIQLAFMPPTIAVPQVKAGKARALAFTGPVRWPLMADVPALAETVPGLVIAAGWDGCFVPARVPGEIVTRLQAEIRKAAHAPKVREFLVNGGYDPIGSTPGEFRKFFHSEIKRYAQIVQEAKIQPE